MLGADNMLRRPWFTDKNGNKKQPKNDCDDMLSTQEEIDACAEKYIRHYQELRSEFKSKTKLTDFDMVLLFIAASVQCLRWAVITNDSLRFSTAKAGEKFVDNKAKWIGTRLPTVRDIIMDHQVPYDAVTRSNFYKTNFLDDNFQPISTRISGTNHRYTALGHDPLAGLLFGTMNIATNTLTKNDYMFSSYIISDHKIDRPIAFFEVLDMTKSAYYENPLAIGAAFIKQIIHCSTDVFTKQGLPLPIINNISPETSKFLIGNRIDLYSVTRGVALTVLLNKIIEMVHKLYYDSSCDDKKLYEVRTRKVLTYSNMLSSVINVGYVGITKDLSRLDVGGILVTLWRILNDEKKIRKIEEDFIQKILDNEFKQEEDEVKQDLAKLGFEI